MTYSQHFTEPAMCYPSSRELECALCSRYRPGHAMPAELRDVIVIDASTVKQKGGCPMYAARQVVTPFHEVETA